MSKRTGKEDETIAKCKEQKNAYWKTKLTRDGKEKVQSNQEENAATNGLIALTYDQCTS